MNFYPFHIGPTLAQKNSQLRAARLRMARAKGRHTAEQWKALVKKFEGRCVRCGVLPSESMQKDHITPIYQGGSDGIDNLQPLCRGCNSAKGPESFNWAAYREANGFEVTL